MGPDYPNHCALSHHIAAPGRRFYEGEWPPSRSSGSRLRRPVASISATPAPPCSTCSSRGARGGTFILRFDDTDRERSRTEYADAIEADLDWLGIKPDLVRRQSERMGTYDEAAAKLKELGRLYPAYETPEELDRRRKLQQARGLPPIYDRAALRLSADERAALEASGRKPHWRFRLEPTIVRWDDMVRGVSHIDSASLSDPVLRREDGTYLYTLPSVVDDIDFGVTHVIRGEDHVTNTAVQIQIFEALARRGAALRPSQPPDRRRRRGPLEALRRALDRRIAHQGNRAARRRRACGARRLGRGGAAGCFARRTGGACRPFATLPRRGSF